MAGVLGVLAAVSACGGSGQHAAGSPSSVAATGAPSSGAVSPASPASPPAVSGRLSASELPAGAVEQWQPLAAPHVQAVSSAIQVNECASVQGAAAWQQQAYVSTYRTPAEQDLFTFHDNAAAQHAYQALLTQMDGCQTQSRALQTKSLGAAAADAQVATTAQNGQGTAWSRRWTGVEGISAGGPQTDHLYAVQQGSTLAVVHFDEWASSPAAPYSTRADGDLLTSVARKLG
ncbi:hypothetical protein OG455_31720 [Kitasatospora sp. NBC_01287]|uniref:hypothetical protein n=1 Tax=Kitasatospora sp. NBC_01287 TaxID=2903573 RepID=UPI00225698E9|nr:hypothetical protein [Kitasatospora sp. NBC_01287]MCX4750035.1 hypothetical protein [Kitasatospora sp. NBC_01287]